MPSDPSDHSPAFERVPLPKSQNHQILIPRDATPTVGRMLDDAYSTLASQLGHYRVKGSTQPFSNKDASAFQKLVQSLTTLQESERKNRDSLKLSELTSEELGTLARQSTRLLNSKS